MELWVKIIVCFIAGMGAGITPMLVTFLGLPAYEAVGIALASDVLASAVSASTYGRNRNLDIRNGLIMMAAVLVFTMVGSFVSSKVPNTAMGNFSVVMTLILGIKFIVKPVMTTKEKMMSEEAGRRALKSVIFGSLVGFVCGFVGAGGGMMMLLILTTALGYELKTAVGTSVFIMAFTASSSQSKHFAFPTKCSMLSSTPLRLTSAPFSARLPVRTLSAPTGDTGLSIL